MILLGSRHIETDGEPVQFSLYVSQGSKAPEVHLHFGETKMAVDRFTFDQIYAIFDRAQTVLGALEQVR